MRSSTWKVAPKFLLTGAQESRAQKKHFIEEMAYGFTTARRDPVNKIYTSRGRQGLLFRVTASDRVFVLLTLTERVLATRSKHQWW